MLPRKPPSTEASHGEADVARRLRSSVGELVRSTRSADRMSPVSAGVLDLLRRHGPMTTAELAERRRVRHQTMATTVADLVRSGLVGVSAHPVDGRKKLNALTAAGQAALDDDAAQREAMLTSAVSRALSEDDLEALTKGLDALELVIAELRRDDDGGGQFVSGHW